MGKRFGGIKSSTVGVREGLQALILQCPNHSSTLEIFTRLSTNRRKLYRADIGSACTSIRRGRASKSTYTPTDARSLSRAESSASRIG